MIFYAAGNFPALRNPKIEQANKEMSEELGHEYNRLVSWFYVEDCETILKMKESEDDGS